MASPSEFVPTSSLGDAIVILGAAGIVIPLFARFRITPVVGFILAGILVGPFGLGGLAAQHPWLSYVTISDPGGLAPFAEFGIILLLFSIGLELSFQRLWQMRKTIFRVGPMELFGGGALIALVLLFLGNSLPTALALGLALALSSTALVLRIADTGTPVGRAALGTLLFEDIALVPIIFLLGAMGRGGESADFGEFMRTLGLGTLVIVALLGIGRFALPRLFAQAARTKSPELFLAASLLVVIVAALVTGAVGLSPIVGALVAGLLIAETDYHTEVETIIEPFKGLALGIFLLTVGMSLDLGMMWDRLWEILVAFTLILLAKALVTGAMLRLHGYRTATATEAGILLASPSETTLIVLASAVAVNLISRDAAQFWQIVTALGLTVTPLLAVFGRWAARRVDRAGALSTPTGQDELQRTLIIGGGRVGKLVADMLTTHDKHYLIIDANADQVRENRAIGLRTEFGDAARNDALHRFGAEQANAVILTMDDPVAVKRMVRQLRNAFPALPIIARARDASHAAALYRAGASHAVPETLEASLQLSEAVLVDIGVPMGPVIASIHEKRDEFRAQIMEEGELDEKPKLKSTTLRERGA
ncbi:MULTISPECIES: cation:proton antiporter [unclassified Novosphingobium]|uniref:cation:proton antiporter domain-containing protein n=1 Tax=unclassified Novosphingobium TaxID=2644732 RepID=UPI000EE85854|nr:MULTISPECIES: cation:proton antiporter [unclassified Novosphingobium]HCF24580.1 sodium:proton exchanger [Novosphingobium sp.]HQV03678.1 cation:proton antiporter [Novosphingobium sp.]